MVVDVRADDWIAPHDAEAFEVTRRACNAAGWGFERVGVPEAAAGGRCQGCAIVCEPLPRREARADQLHERARSALTALADATDTLAGGHA
ncbi:hypothetical protein [Streptomyces scopuliridis]|uniref:hypothetical protein n=1 Tax=Streptomyces scopuliridis TaxID=452529 RepID=UPI00341D000B